MGLILYRQPPPLRLDSPAAGGETIILDNLKVHKVSGVKEAIKAVGAKVMYLPQYLV
jgi:hypothetical protein